MLSIPKSIICSQLLIVLNSLYMNWIEIFFYVSLIIVCYTFLGYGILLYLLVLIKRILKPVDSRAPADYEPFVSLVVPCYNEADLMERKIINCRGLDYPADKLSVYFITDGSTDHFAEVISRYPDIQLLHKSQRAGKAAAENRAMQFVKTPIVIFSDANAILNQEAIRYIVKHFTDERTGCVSGEKRILREHAENASTAGEGIYWKYESLLKNLDAELNSCVGAVGELFAIRSSLYEELPEDTLVDDFMQSMQIASKGYKIAYEPKAIAAEMASENVKEELKRKIRISAGNWQAIKRLSGKLRFTKTPILFFQYISHKVLRWSVVPFFIILVLLLNIPLAVTGALAYKYFLYAQTGFYAIAVAGYVFKNRHIHFTAFFIPYYFCVMNYAALAGLAKFLSGQQKATWEKAKRKVAV